MRNSKKSKTHVPLTFLIHYWIFVASLILELLHFCNFKQNIFLVLSTTTSTGIPRFMLLMWGHIQKNGEAKTA